MLNEEKTTGIGVVIGAGTMGGGIAAQLANAGWQVRLLDVPGADRSDAKTRNQAAQMGLERVQKNRPPLLFLPEYAARIQVGNTEDHLDWLREAAWVVEAVAENMAVKQKVLGQIEAHCGPQTVVSSNTSGLSLQEMSSRCTPDFRRRFLGSHFLNPPRYLKLLEVVTLPETEAEVASGFVRFAEQVIGHRVVMAKDTPGFISTRIWIAHLMHTIQVAIRNGLTVEEVDYLTGPLIGRPRSATFRMADLVGLDIIAAIAKNQYDALPADELGSRYDLLLPDVMARLIADGRTGEKSGAGFYKREGRDILALDFDTLEYRPVRKVEVDAIERLLATPLPERFMDLRHIVHDAKMDADPDCDLLRFLWEILVMLTSYVSANGPEIADDVRAIDNVMKWGFGWEWGPFEMEDWMLKPSQEAVSHIQRNYSGTGAERRMRVFGTEEMQPVPVTLEYISLAELKAAGKTILDAPEGSLIDLGDGVACLEFHTKMNTFDPALCDFMDAARERAEQDFTALIVGNQGAHFSAGYNLQLLLDALEAQDWNRIETLMAQVQEVFGRLKFCSIPIVAAPHGYTLGGGCELALHCAAVQAAPELTMGLPETLAGVVPTGGGMKELLTRFMAEWDGQSDPFPLVERAFSLVAFPKNSANAYEARKMGLLRETDGISCNADRLLYDAKQRGLMLANSGYAPPERRSVRVMGEEALARLRMALHNQYRAGILSDHDRLLADRVAWFMSGGNLPYAQEVSESYLLRLEREVFMALVREPKSGERMRHILATGKPLKDTSMSPRG
jgi:3-hydroxyacyl-CoA dehydrogenase